MRKLASLFLTLMLAALPMAGLAEAAQPTETELVFVVADEITGTDIQQITWENLVHTLLYAPLVLMDATNTEVVANTASEIAVENDGKDLIFTIPEGLCYSNGTAVTAQSAVDNFARYVQISPYASDLDPVSLIEADDNKLIIHCTDVAPYLWAVLTTSYSGLDDVAAAAAAGDEAFNMAAVTYGPYMVEEWKQGQEIVLVKNPNYVSQNPYTENTGACYPAKITVRFISDDYTRVNELISGNVDYIDAVPASNLVELQNTEGITVAENYQAGCEYLILNTSDPVLSDSNVRLAIAKSINRDELCAAQDGTIIPADGFLTPTQIGYSAESAESLKAQYAYDPEGAAQLFADAGWSDSDGDGYLDKDGQKMSFTFLVANDTPSLRNAAPVIQYQLKNAGVELVISEMEGAAIKVKVKDGDYQIGTRKYAWTDADMLTNLFGTSSGYYSNEALDKLLDEARYIADGTERAAKYAEAQQLIVDQLPGVPLFYEIQYTAYSDQLMGVKYSSTGMFLVDDVYKK